MTTKELKIAKNILDNRTERFSVACIDTGGFALTAYWIDGGQKLFYTISQVTNWINDKNSWKDNLYHTYKK